MENSRKSDEFIDNRGIKIDDAFYHFKNSYIRSTEMILCSPPVKFNSKKLKKQFKDVKNILNSTPIISNPIYKELKTFFKGRAYPLKLPENGK